MGLTYKENVADIRETPVMGIIKELREFGIEIFGFDPLLRREEIEAFGISALETVEKINVDCVIITVAHDAFKDKPFLRKKAFTERNIPLLVKVFSLEKKLLNNDPILVDIRGMFDREDAKRVGFCYRSL